MSDLFFFLPQAALSIFADCEKLRWEFHKFLDGVS